MHESFSAAPFNAVPVELLQVVDNVIELTGITVTAQPYSEEFKREQPGLSRDEAMLDIDPSRSTITIWFDPLNVSAATIGHELIHLRRNIVESVPKLFPLTSSAAELHEEIYLLENEVTQPKELVYLSRIQQTVAAPLEYVPFLFKDLAAGDENPTKGTTLTAQQVSDIERLAASLKACVGFFVFLLSDDKLIA